MGWAGRFAGGGLLLLVVLAAGVGHVGWLRAADGALIRKPAVGSEEPAPSETPAADPAREATKKRYSVANRPRRSGSTELKIALVNGGVWTAGARHTLDLQPSDPMVSDLRTGAQTLGEWLPFEFFTGGVTDDCPGLSFSETFESGQLVQAKPTATAHASYVEATSWSASASVYDCLDGHGAITLIDEARLLGANGIYDSWTLAIDVPARSIIAIRGGTTLSQDVHHAELRLPTNGERVTVVLGDTEASDTPMVETIHEQSDVEHLSALLQSESPLREAIWLALALAAVSVCWVLPFVRTWSPPGSRRSWTAVAVAACALTGVLLLYGLVGDATLWSEWWLDPGRGSMLEAWWWMALPLLLAAFLVRFTRGRPPRLRELLPILLPSAVLPALAVVYAVTARTPWPLAAVAASVVATGVVAYALRRGLLGVTGRRWAVTAAGAVWLAVLDVGPGMGIPVVEGVSWVRDVTNSLGVVATAWGWLALALFVAIAVTRHTWVARLGWPLLGAYLVVPAVVMGWSGAWLQSYDGDRWLIIGTHPANAASFPGAQLYIAYGVVLLWLWTHGTRHPGWPRNVRALAVGLGISGAATGLAAYGFAMFGDGSQRGGYYIALLIASVGFAWLLPSSAEPRAVRLHKTRPAAHNRLMHALLKDQALAAGRREFLTASRTALAEGDLTARQWSARWRRLGALGDRGTAPQHSVDLRLTALGTSGGRTALRNALAAAVLLTALAVPWMAYTVPTPLSDDSPGDQQVWAHALRWAVYGFVYGYAYSWLRGGSPLGKALCLLAVVLPAELAQLLFRALPPDDFGISLLLTAGNCLAMFLVLGLYWEARLVRVAGLRWGQIRNFRSLSAAAVPVTTVVVASATALATAMVGAWITPDSNPTPTNPGAGPSVSAEASPKP